MLNSGPCFMFTDILGKHNYSTPLNKLIFDFMHIKSLNTLILKIISYSSVLCSWSTKNPPPYF